MVVVLEIDDRCGPKPFLGGWRDPRRDVEYHDAACQTRRGLAVGSRRDNTAQTSSSGRTRDASVWAERGVDRATQASTPFPRIGDRVLRARRSGPAGRREEAAARKIQRFYRAHRMRHRRQGCSSDELDVESAARLTERGNKLELAAASTQDDEAESRRCDDRSTLFIDGAPHYPCSSSPQADAAERLEPKLRLDDVVTLRELLERWALLAEEAGRGQTRAELLEAAGASRSEAAARRDERARARFLDELARPVQLHVPRQPDETGAEAGGEKTTSRAVVHVDTLGAQRAREFRDLYDALALERDDCLEGPERIELLFNLRRIAAQHTCPASSALERLLDQELFLMSTRAEPSRLKHLRSRVRLGFLRLARGALLRRDTTRQPKFLPRTQLCLSCGRLKDIEAFESDYKGRVWRRCVYCAAALNERRQQQWQQHEPEVCSGIYERLLRVLRVAEGVRRRTRPLGNREFR